MNERETEAMVDAIELAADAMTEVATLTERLREAEKRAEFISEDLNTQIDDEQARITKLELKLKRLRSENDTLRALQCSDEETLSLRAENERLREDNMDLTDACDKKDAENERLNDALFEATQSIARYEEENERFREDLERACEDPDAAVREENERLRADLKGGRAQAIEQRDRAETRVVELEAEVERLRTVNAKLAEELDEQKSLSLPETYVLLADANNRLTAEVEQLRADAEYQRQCAGEEFVARLAVEAEVEQLRKDLEVAQVQVTELDEAVERLRSENGTLRALQCSDEETLNLRAEVERLRVTLEEK